MLQWFVDLFAWLFSKWKDIPDDIKRKFVDAFVQGLELLIREYFRAQAGGAT